MTVIPLSLPRLLHFAFAAAFSFWGFPAIADDPSASSACGADAQQYWKAFRSAALKPGAEAIADLSSFPFEVRGTMDDDPAQKLGRVEFVKRWGTFLKSDPGMSARPSTMKAFVKAHPRLVPAFCSEGGQQFRVANWVFQLKPDGWRFVQAFVDA